jgi:hypothetical protein
MVFVLRFAVLFGTETKNVSHERQASDIPVRERRGSFEEYRPVLGRMVRAARWRRRMRHVAQGNGGVSQGALRTQRLVAADGGGHVRTGTRTTGQTRKNRRVSDQRQQNDCGASRNALQSMERDEKSERTGLERISRSASRRWTNPCASLGPTTHPRSMSWCMKRVNPRARSLSTIRSLPILKLPDARRNSGGNGSQTSRNISNSNNHLSGGIQ